MSAARQGVRVSHKWRRAFHEGMIECSRCWLTVKQYKYSRGGNGKCPGNKSRVEIFLKYSTPEIRQIWEAP